MNPRLCGLLLLLSWFICLTYYLLQSLMVLRVFFCKETEIPHFLCELPQILKLACSDVPANDILLYVVTGLLGVIPLTGILFSYSRIVYSIMGISSTVGQHSLFHLWVSSLSHLLVLWCPPWGVCTSLLEQPMPPERVQ